MNMHAPASLNSIASHSQNTSSTESLAALHALSTTHNLRHLLLHSFQILTLVGGKQPVRLLLGGGCSIWIVEKILNAQQNLPDCDGRLPILILIQNAQTNSSGRIDVWMEERLPV